MDPNTLGATELATALREKKLSATELTQHYLQHIARDNPRLHAFTYVAPERALKAAAAWDQARPVGTLSGVPIGIKDLAWVRMMPSQGGSRAFRYLWTPIDDPVVARVRAAGMIILGKTATSEFGALPVTEPVLHPPTENAHAPGFSAGGSSGGAGSAVGAGLVPIAHGSDGGGSIRIPSALNRLVGFKHSRGLLVHVPPPDAALQLTTAGPLARSVTDAAAFQELLFKTPMQLMNALSSPWRPLRVALATETPLAPTQPEHATATRMVADVLRRLGCEIVERPWTALTDADFLVLWMRLMANIPFAQARLLEPATRWLKEGGRHITKAAALAKRHEMEAAVTAWFGDVDLWLSPTTAMTAPRHGAVIGATPEETFHNVLGLGAYTAPWNVGGQPAVSLPVARMPNGVGIGVQLAGRVGQDALVLRVAREIEQTLGGFWPARP